MNELKLRQALSRAIELIGDLASNRDDYPELLQGLGIDMKELEELPSIEELKVRENFAKLESKGIGNEKLKMILVDDIDFQEQSIVYIDEKDKLGIADMIHSWAATCGYYTMMSEPKERVLVKMKVTSNGNLGCWDDGTFSHFAEKSDCGSCGGGGWVDPDIESVDEKEEEIHYKALSLKETLESTETWFDAWSRIGVEFEIV
jgi:hypothetical protein